MAKNTKSISTRAELDRLVEDRKNDPPHAQHNYPRPSWMVDPYDDVRRHIRMRERRIRRLENRLDGSTKKMEQDFDQSS